MSILDDQNLHSVFSSLHFVAHSFQLFRSHFSIKVALKILWYCPKLFENNFLESRLGVFLGDRIRNIRPVFSSLHFTARLFQIFYFHFLIRGKSLCAFQSYLKFFWSPERPQGPFRTIFCTLLTATPPPIASASFTILFLRMWRRRVTSVVVGKLREPWTNNGTFLPHFPRFRFSIFLLVNFRGFLFTFLF